ncbi:uncharacterized protein LOC119372295 isoform X2 [Rhipicephalus sanguineus]|uniref:uncharacterized protein LOC119372295 isoform X2 n=1 Tax=Rhipicephalus sanguineus TaxID=34632 RepID=UPI0020C47886|nr:uncharacterized protein LOC119372295 isoform X2 [Rhipicephalus sanguineus]
MTGTEQSLQGPRETPHMEFTSVQSAATITTDARSSAATETPEASTRSTAVATTDDALKTASASAMSTLSSVWWSVDNRLPQFSPVVQPLLNGLDLSESEHRRQSRQLRHELIHFLDKNGLIQDENHAIRRWKYSALGESLASVYPNMLWERAQKDKQGRTKSPKSVFISRLAEARRHRGYRRAKKVPSQAQVAENEDITEELDAAVALSELSVLQAAASPAGPFDEERMLVLLRASLSERKLSPPPCLPCYFLNEDIISIEAELRFEDKMSSMLARLRLAKEVVSKTCGREMDFVDIDDYLKGNHAKYALITLSLQLWSK